jgi:hypothetical protein
VTGGFIKLHRCALDSTRWYRVGANTTQCRQTAAEWAKRSGLAVEVARDVTGAAVESWRWGNGAWCRVPVLPAWMRLLGCSAPLYVMPHADGDQAREIERLYRLHDAERRRVRAAAVREWVMALPRREVT